MKNVGKYLKNQIPVFTYDVTDSTNVRAKEYIRSGHCERALFVANAQTSGRGRLGRTFYSPADSGIYMTYAYKTDAPLCDAVRVTTATAVTVAEAIGDSARIKWVNDIYVGGKKVCGILTEAVHFGGSLYVVIGIGINVTTADFPDELQGIAGSIGKADRARLCADICDGLYDIDKKEYIDSYRKRLLWRGEQIVYTENNGCHIAVLLDVDEDGHLIVVENGNKKTLRSGEISVRAK